ncbi:F0F1 ATP synthase subunit epsilon [Pseudorhodoferax sp.]|uniref:F0F1 ATP synthase subunit epsilon n=1 Tax=Pseudorhodoferax sp. TaxID=1993553 RepID=UPI0039E28908
MPERTLHLSISTPGRQVVDAHGVLALRARDASGSFGVLPGHADLLTVLVPSVVRWREAGGAERFCAVRGGVFTMAGGTHAAIACRQAVLGDQLAALPSDVAAANAEQADVDRRARVAQMQLHARAVRQLMRYLVPGRGDGAAVAEQLFEGGPG